MTTLHDTPVGAPVTDEGAPRPRRIGYVVSGLVAIPLVLASLVLPLWQATLVAPQYPGGLTMQAYGHQVTGDIAEIDILNHYVGMRAFNPADVWEMALWPAAVGVGVLLALVSAFAGPRLVGRLARLGLWAMPVGVLADIQLRLYQYGHDLAPVAAIRIPEFTPWVVGPTKVMNFTTWAFPGLGIGVLVLAAVVATFGPRLVNRLARGGRPATVATAAVVALLLVTVPAVPATAATGHEGHGDHSPAAPASDGGDADHAGHDHEAYVREQTRLQTPSAATPAAPAAGVGGETRDDLADRLAAAAPGDRVILAPGTYVGNVVIDTPITLEGRDLPTILGDGTGTTLTVRAAGTVITGLRVRGSGPGPDGSPAAIKIEADDVTVSETVIEDAYVGIAVAGAKGVRLLDNCVTGRSDARVVEDDHAAGGDDHPAMGHDPASQHTPGRGDGISLWDADGLLLRGNHVTDTRDGIYVSFGSETLIDGNEVTRSRYAVHTMFARDLTLAENVFHNNLSGAILMYGGPTLLLRNQLVDNHSESTGFGLLFKDVSGAQAAENVIARNRVGLHLDGPTSADDPVRVMSNTVALNQIGASLYPSARGVFAVNSFANNLVQVMPQGGALPEDKIVWSERGSGNYWSTYRGYEQGFDDYGAVAHAEGGSVEQLLTRAPVLTALASSPALRLLRGMEQRWSSRTPVVTDHVPLTRPHSPALPSPESTPASRNAMRGSALLLVAAGATLLLRHRRPRKSTVHRLPSLSPERAAHAA